MYVLLSYRQLVRVCVHCNWKLKSYTNILYLYKSIYLFIYPNVQLFWISYHRSCIINTQYFQFNIHHGCYTEIKQAIAFINSISLHRTKYTLQHFHNFGLQGPKMNEILLLNRGQCNTSVKKYIKVLLIVIRSRTLRHLSAIQCQDTIKTFS